MRMFGGLGFKVLCAKNRTEMLDWHLNAVSNNTNLLQ